MRKLLYFFPILFFWAPVVFSASMPISTEGTPNNAFVSVKFFGAKGDGLADDTKAIQAALDSFGNGALYLPDGTYKVTDKLTLHSGLRLMGQSVDGTIISSSGTTALYSPEWATSVIIEALTIVGDNTPNTYGVHIYKNQSNAHLRNLIIKGFGTSNIGGGVYLDGGGKGKTWGTTLENIEVKSCGRGFVVSSAQAITLLNCKTKWNLGPSYFNGVNGLTILGGAYEYTNQDTGGNSWNMHLDNVHHVFVHSYFEQARDGHIKIENSNLVTVTNSQIQGYSGNSMTYGWVYLKNSSLCKISGNKIGSLDGNFNGKALIYLDADSHDNIVELNDLEPDGSLGPNYHAINLGKGNIFINNRGHQNINGNIGPINVLWGRNKIQIEGLVTGSERMASIESFAANDATPDVGNGYIFKTSNTRPTLITGFDHAGSGGLNLVGQEILVLIGDNNTRIDFTGTMLKGNGGKDWSTSKGDHMECFRDEKNWYCRVSDNTAD